MLPAKTKDLFDTIGEKPHSSGPSQTKPDEGHERPAAEAEAPRGTDAQQVPDPETPKPDAGRPSDSRPETATREAPLPLEELRAISDEIAHTFPMPIEETELVLMEVDPHRVHAYWNVDGVDLAAARDRLGAVGPPAPLVLRFYDVTPSSARDVDPEGPFDVEVQGLQSHTYVDLWRDGRAYEAELGLRTAEGGLERLAGSNTVQTPRAGESPSYPQPPQINVAPQTDAPAKPSEHGLPEPGIEDRASAEVEAVDAQTSHPAGSSQSAASRQAVASPMLAAVSGGTTEARPAATAARDARRGPDARGYSQASGFPVPARAHGDTSEADSACTFEPSRVADPTLASAGSEELAPVFPNVDDEESDQTRAEMPPLSGGAILGPSDGSGSAGEMSRTATAPRENAAQPIEDVLTPSPPEAMAGVHLPAAVREGCRPEDAKVALGPSGGPAAAALSPERAEAGPIVSFWSNSLRQREVELELNADLHISGRARPGSRFTLFGRPVPLRPDGTFSIRRPLPTGALVVPLLMTAGDFSSEDSGEV
jgi:hypothetical protein